MGSERAMFRFAVWPDGGERYEVDATMRDVIRWERGSKTKATGIRHLRDTMYSTDLVRICYFASVRHGLFTGTVQDFEEACDWAPLRGEDDDPRQDVIDAAVAWRRDAGDLEDLAAAVDELLAAEAGDVDPTRPAP